MTVEEGVTIKLSGGRSIVVFGNLILNGTAEKNINIQPRNEGEHLAQIGIGAGRKNRGRIC